MPRRAAFFDQTYFPYVDSYPDDLSELPRVMPLVLWSGLVHSPWDHDGDEGFWGTLRAQTLALREATDRELMVVVGCNLFEWGTFLRRIDDFLMDLVMDQANVERLLDALLQIHFDTLDHVIEAVGDLVDIVRFGDDLGMDNGPLMSPRTYRDIFKPRHAALDDYVHEVFAIAHDMLPDVPPQNIEAMYEAIDEYRP